MGTKSNARGGAGEENQRVAGAARVLVIDPDPMSLGVVVSRLEKAGYAVQGRREALGTMALLTRDPGFAVVLTEVLMPGLSGGALADLIAKNPKTAGIGVVFHSSLGAAELATTALMHRVRGVINKSRDRSAFLTAFARTCPPPTQEEIP